MIQLILTLALVGLIVYLIVCYVPMPEPIKIAIYVIVAICVIFYLMQVFGIGDLPVPRVR